MLGFEYNAEDEKQALIELGIEQGIELGIERGIGQGIELGIGQGIEQGKIDVIKNLLKMKMSVENIAAAIGYSKEKILHIIKEISK